MRETENGEVRGAVLREIRGYSGIMKNGITEMCI